MSNAVRFVGRWHYWMPIFVSVISSFVWNLISFLLAQFLHRLNYWQIHLPWPLIGPFYPGYVGLFRRSIWADPQSWNGCPVRLAQLVRSCGRWRKICPMIKYEQKSAKKNNNIHLYFINHNLHSDKFWNWWYKLSLFGVLKLV